MAAPNHQMNPFGDRGKIVGVYCIAKTCDGEYLTDVMSMEDIEKIRKAAKQDGVWSKWFEEMAKKAIIKRASKQWPLGKGEERFSQAVSVVNDVEGGEPIRERDVTPHVETICAEQRENLVKAIEAIGRDEQALCQKLQVDDLMNLPSERYVPAMTWLNNQIKKIESVNKDG